MASLRRKTDGFDNRRPRRSPPGTSTPRTERDRRLSALTTIASSARRRAGARSPSAPPSTTAKHVRRRELRSAAGGRLHHARHPRELGGLGASLRQVCYAQAELARYCGATALAVNMHIYLTLTQRLPLEARRRRAERLLRRVAAERADPDDQRRLGRHLADHHGDKGEGGFRVNGRKAFCSQAPIANALSTFATYDDPIEGQVLLAMGIPTTQRRGSDGRDLGHAGDARHGQPRRAA